MSCCIFCSILLERVVIILGLTKVVVTAILSSQSEGFSCPYGLLIGAERWALSVLSVVSFLSVLGKNVQ